MKVDLHSYSISRGGGMLRQTYDADKLVRCRVGLDIAGFSFRIGKRLRT